MDNSDKKEIFFNRAEVQKAEEMHCDICFEEVVFLLRDKDHDFSMGLTSVLECLAFAIVNGSLPKLPESWVSDVENTLGVHFDEEISYYDYETFEKRNPLK